MELSSFFPDLLLAVIDFEQALEQVVQILGGIAIVAIFGAFIAACVLAATGRVAMMVAAIVSGIVAALGWSLLTFLFETFFEGGGGIQIPGL